MRDDGSVDGLPRPTGESAVRASALQNTLQRLRDHARALAVHHARHGVHGALRPAAFTGDPPAVGHGTGAAELSAAVLRYAAPEVAGRIAAPMRAATCTRSARCSSKR